MRKLRKSPEAQPLRQFYALQPWRCEHHSDHSEIAAYVEASGQWECVATIHLTSGANAEALADYIAALVSTHQKNRPLLQDAMSALEAVITDGLTFATEQEADSVLNRIKQVI